MIWYVPQNQKAPLRIASSSSSISKKLLNYIAVKL